MFQSCRPRKSIIMETCLLKETQVNVLCESLHCNHDEPIKSVFIRMGIKKHLIQIALSLSMLACVCAYKIINTYTVADSINLFLL